MFIENPDKFKAWLTSILEPLCDADPAALAKYVYALVKKDRPINDLRSGMMDQLDVFLQEETKPFVEMLFKSLETEEYLRAEVEYKPPPSPKPLEIGELVVEEPVEVPTQTEVTEQQPQPPLPPVEPMPMMPEMIEDSPEFVLPLSDEAPDVEVPVTNRVVVSRTAPKPATRPAPMEKTLVRVVPLNELLEEPLDQPPKRRDRRNEPLRDKDDRRRRRSRSWDWRGRPRRHGSPERRRPLRSPSPRNRYKNRSPPQHSVSRSRSRSPVPRERGHERERGRAREIDRDRMSREMDMKKRISRSNERERSRERSPLREGEPLPPGYRRRCRDYDEKGYCMRGDLCQWDHGSDPVVLEDTALTRVMTIPPSVPEYNPLTPDIWANPMTPSYAPFPPHHHGQAPPPPRELIPIPRVREMGGVPPALTNMISAPTAPVPPRHPGPRKPFEYARTAPPRQPLSAHAAKCALEVRKVPRGLNDITHLNNHFSKFGKIINIQVCYEGDPEAALITFSNHTEANVAYKSTEAVLNNRFIKVFWHNPENKQDIGHNTNVERAPGSHNKVFINKDNIKQTHMNKDRAAEIALNAEKINAEKKLHDNGNGFGHDRVPGSHNKVFINKDNIKQTQLNKEKAAILAASLAGSASEQNNAGKSDQPTATPSTTSTTAATKPAGDNGTEVREMIDRIHNLLKSQTSQQMVMIQKLQSGEVTGEQRPKLLQAIVTAQDGIEKLRKEVVAYNNLLAQIKKNKNKTPEQTHKEILDAELDLIIKQQEGKDTSQISKKINDMRQQLRMYPGSTSLPVTRPPLRGGRVNTNMRFVRGATPAKPPVVSVNQTVDHRPRTLLVSGFEADELDTLVHHFACFGEIVAKDVNLAVPELVIQYKLRQQAEMALAHGKSYNERFLSITWVPGVKPISSTSASSVPGEENVAGVFEEEEDDEQEDRSWRR